jgi:hypothetical protein
MVWQHVACRVPQACDGDWDTSACGSVASPYRSARRCIDLCPTLCRACSIALGVLQVHHGVAWWGPTSAVRGRASGSLIAHSSAATAGCICTPVWMVRAYSVQHST